MKIEVSAVMDEDAQVLFWLSQDYGRRLEWDRYLVEARLLEDGVTADTGVLSYCRNRLGVGMTSRYVSFSPPTHAAVTMTDGPWILRSFAGTWRFKPLENGRTEVRFIYHFSTRIPVLRWVLEPALAAWYRRDMLRRPEAFGQWVTNTPGLGHP